MIHTLLSHGTSRINFRSIPEGSKSLLLKYQGLHVGLIPGEFESLQSAVEEGKFNEIAPGCEWIVWLVLHLLRELRNPRSRWLAYIQMLPAPPGSLVKAICPYGPDATDLLFFRQVNIDSINQESIDKVA